MSDRRLDFLINAKETATPVINSVRRSFDDLQKQGADAGQGFISKLNESFGRSSDLGSVAKLLAGGGAIFAINRISKEFAAMAEEGEKLADAIRKGDGSAGEMAEKFAESLPILGNIVHAGSSINEIITGDKLALSEANKEAEVTIKLTEHMRGSRPAPRRSTR